MTTDLRLRVSRLVAGAALSLVLMPWNAASAQADSASAGADLVVAQTLGDRELTVVVRRVTSAPGPLSVDVITHTGTAPGTLTLAVTPTGAGSAPSELPAPGAPTATAEVQLGAQPGAYSAVIPVDRSGPWELALDDGQRTARIPFLVTKQVPSPPEWLAYVGLISAGVLLLVAGAVGLRTRRSGWALIPGGAAVAALAVGVTGALLSSSLPLPPQPGTQVDPSVDNAADPFARNKPMVADYSRPPVTLTMNSAPVVAGRPVDIGLALADGATGLPADDLIVHDAALIHLLIVGPTGELWHLHPIRTGPGRYQLHVNLPEVGHYAVSAELVRRGGGVQSLRAPAGLDVAGRAPKPAAGPSPTHLNSHLTMTTVVVGAVPIHIASTPAVAGLPVTVTATVGGAPDLQLWLGMVGHMIVAGPLPGSGDVGTAVQAAPVWAHTHSMGGMSPMQHPMATMSTMNSPGEEADSVSAMTAMNPVNGDSAPDETVSGYGPQVPFTFTFPAAGSYRLWIQVERDYTVLTIPLTVDVGGAL
jgi:hypothetical protein